MRSEKLYPTLLDYPPSRSPALEARHEAYIEFLAQGHKHTMAARLARTSPAGIRFRRAIEPAFQKRIRDAKERHRQALLDQREAEFRAWLVALAPRALIEEDLAKLDGHQYEALLPVWAKRFSDIPGIPKDGVPVRKRHETTCWVWPVDDLRPGGYYWHG